MDMLSMNLGELNGSTLVTCPAIFGPLDSREDGVRRKEAIKKTRFTEEQMVTILREADAKPVPEVAKKHGVAAATIYAWRKHFGGLEPTDVKRLRQLEHENGRLKKLVADLTLDVDILKEVSRKKW